MSSIVMKMPVPSYKFVDNTSNKLHATRSSSTAAATTRRRLRCSALDHRRSGNYGPPLWDAHYILSLNYDTKDERQRAEDLIGEVRKTLMVDDDRRLELIDELHRLGISRHFENEIFQILNSDHHHSSDLYSTSLRFRLLRHHGFTVSQEVFDCFKNKEGTDFKPSLGEDIKGLIQLYEASLLQKEGEETLELARKFSTKLLETKLKEGGGGRVSSSIRETLEFPIHWRVIMPNAKSFIEAYKMRPDMNPVMLELAKLDFKMAQAQFQEELKQASRWWENTSLVQQLPFVRDRIVECYFWTTGVVQQRQHGYERIMLTKINALVTTIDDVYDIYGTLPELHLFTTAIQRWDDESMKKLPPYMQVCYLALYNFVHESAYDILKEKGFNPLPYLHKTWVDLVEAYLIEATWYHTGYKPSMQEYLNNAWISIGGVPILSHLFFRLTDSIQEEDAESMHGYHELVRASCTILRLADDMGTSLDEVERGDVPKSIQCYMNEKGCGEEEAREHVRSLIRETWKTMNTEMMGVDSPFSKYFVQVCANLGRMAQFIYQGGSDGFGMQHSTVNQLLRGLIFEPYE